MDKFARLRVRVEAYLDESQRRIVPRAIKNLNEYRGTKYERVNAEALQYFQGKQESMKRVLAWIEELEAE